MYGLIRKALFATSPETVNPGGKETFQYFSEKTGLLIGGEGVQSSPMGEVDVTTMLADYKEFGGILQPTSTTLQMSGMEIIQTVDETTFDDVEENAFEPPDSIKALIK